MKLENREIKALQKSRAGQHICIWRVGEPTWHPGRVYQESDVGSVTVVATILKGLEKIQLVDVKRSGWSTYADLVAWLIENGGAGQRIWESRMIRGDHSGKPRLLKHIGGVDPNYTNQPHLAMKGEPEALTEQQLRDIAGRSADERAAAIEAFKRRTIEEASTLFRGEDALRNFTRITHSLGKPK